MVRRVPRSRLGLTAQAKVVTAAHTLLMEDWSLVVHRLRKEDLDQCCSGHHSQAASQAHGHPGPSVASAGQGSGDSHIRRQAARGRTLRGHRNDCGASHRHPPGQGHHARCGALCGVLIVQSAKLETGAHGQKKIQFFMHDGSKRKARLGPPSFKYWWASFRVYRTAFLLLDVLLR